METTRQSCSIRKFQDNGVSKQVQATIALFIMEHCSIMSVNHLAELCRKYFSQEAGGDLTMCRTKCTSVIKKVLGPYFLANLVAGIINGPYSLAIDESIDNTVQTKLGIVRLYNIRQKSVINFSAMTGKCSFGSSSEEFGISDQGNLQLVFLFYKAPSTTREHL